MGKIIGIDLGTTNSLVSVYEDGEIKLIPNEKGDYLTPSVVHFFKDGSYVVGKEAKEYLKTEASTTFATFKRSMGTDKVFAVPGNRYTPIELSACVLKSLKADAERYLGEEVTEAVISVPAYFADKARSATKSAGQLAGLKVDRIINEPSAAALAYKYHENKESINEEDEDNLDERRMLIFDFGGGTLDISILDSFDKVVEIVAVSGDNQLGGVDFDKAIADYFLRKMEIDVKNLGKEEYNAILAIAEKVKIQLSDELEVAMEAVIKGKEYSLSISRKGLIKICSEVLMRISAPLKRALVDSESDVSDIDDIVLVGGSSKMPIVQQYIMHLLNTEKVSVSDPDCMIGLGMGAYAGIKERNADVKDYILTDVCPFSLGTGIHNKNNPGKDIMSFIIPRNTALPASKANVYYPVYDGQKYVEFIVYQGEERYAKDNMELGKMKIDLKHGATTDTRIFVTYTYDINGILLIDIEIPTMKIKKQLSIINNELKLSKHQLDDKIKELNKLKKPISTFDKDDDVIVSRCTKLFVESPDYLKSIIAVKMDYYIKNRYRDLYKLELLQKKMSEFLDTIESKLNAGIEAFDVEDSDWYKDDFIRLGNIDFDLDKEFDNDDQE